MNDKYIKLDDAIHVINCTNTFTFSRERTIEKLREVLAADVRPVVRGRWIAASDTSGNEYYRCSECGTYFERTFFGNDYTVNGCPVCFADMRGNADQEQGADNSAHRDICGATGLPCCRCNPGACESRK